MQKSRTISYHPEGNGVLERFHRTLKERFLTSHKSTDWVNLLAPSLFAYRITPHNATSMPPFQLTYGFTPQIPQDWPLRFSGNGESYVSSLRTFWDLVKRHNGEAGIARRLLNVGDLVLVRKHRNNKLERPWDGPHPITKILGPTTIEVANQGTIHVNRLKFFSAAPSPLVGGGM